MKTKRIIAFLLAVSLVLGFTPETTVTYAAKKMALNKKKITLQVGSSTTLKVKNTKKKVTWKSSNKKVAIVSKKGKVTALKKGTAKITAKVSGKKFTCNVNVVKKKKSTTQAAKTDNNATDVAVSTTQSSNAQTTTEQAQVATTTESNQAQTTTTTQAQESTTTQEDSLDVKELNLSDIHFDSDGYSTENFFIDFSMMVTASGMNYKEYYYSEEEFDDVTLSFVNSKGDIREFHCGIYPGAEENEFTLKTSAYRNSSGKPVQGLCIPIGNYDVLYDGFYCASITPNDFKNLLNYESSSTYDADVQVPEVNIVIGSGTVTNSSNVANSDIDILIQQFVGEKEYTSYASLGNDGTYTKCFIDGYNYDVLPCGLGDEKITANVSDGQIQGSLDIKVSADYQKVIFNDSKNEFNLEQHNLSLKSDTNEIRICDENNNYYAIVLADTYDLYYDECIIQKNIVITKETTEIDLIMPHFTVTLSMNGVSVTDLSDYKVANEKTKEEIAIPSEANAFEVTPGTYTLSYMSNVVGKYTVSLDSAADDGMIVWEIPCVKVSLKNFDTSLNIGDYVVKDENETEIEMEEGAVEVTLPAGDYDVNEKNGEELGDYLGQYSVTWEQASQGSNVVWDLELASVTGKITGISPSDESIDFYKKNSDGEYEYEKRIPIGNYIFDETELKNYWQYSVKLHPGDYKFAINEHIQGGMLWCRGEAFVTVNQETLNRNIDFVEAKIYLDCPENWELSKSITTTYGGGMGGLVHEEEGTERYYGTFYLDRNSTYDLYLEDSSGKQIKIATAYCYGDKTSDTINLGNVIETVYTDSLTESLPEVQNYDFLQIVYEGTPTRSRTMSKDNKLTLFEEGTYTIKGGTYGVYFSEFPVLATLTLKDGIFTYSSN